MLGAPYHRCYRLHAARFPLRCTRLPTRCDPVGRCSRSRRAQAGVYGGLRLADRTDWQPQSYPNCSSIALVVPARSHLRRPQDTPGDGSPRSPTFNDLMAQAKAAPGRYRTQPLEQVRPNSKPLQLTGEPEESKALTPAGTSPLPSTTGDRTGSIRAPTVEGTPAADHVAEARVNDPLEQARRASRLMSNSSDNRTRV
jgi:hypothetical protein